MSRAVAARKNCAPPPLQFRDRTFLSPDSKRLPLHRHHVPPGRCKIGIRDPGWCLLDATHHRSRERYRRRAARVAHGGRPPIVKRRYPSTASRRFTSGGLPGDRPRAGARFDTASGIGAGFTVEAENSEMSLHSRRADFGERLVHHAQQDVGLGFREDERRSQADGVLARAENQDTATEHRLNEGIALVDGSLLGLSIFDEFDTYHQALAANVADKLMLFLRLAEPIEQMRAD